MKHSISPPTEKEFDIQCKFLLEINHLSIHPSTYSELHLFPCPACISAEGLDALLEHFIDFHKKVIQKDASSELEGREQVVNRPTHIFG